MTDFRLKVFQTVARSRNFTQAASELHISQPAVTGHIKELEKKYGVQLFNRSRNGLELTHEGQLFMDYADEILEKYRDLEFEMNLIEHKKKGTLRVGASTTLAQYIMPSIMASFMKRFPEISLSMISGNTLQIEEAVCEKKVDIGMIEGCGHKSEFNYSLFSMDELVLVTPVSTHCPDEITLDELRKIPLVLRENGSGTLDVIENILTSHSVRLSDLNIRIQLGSTESIKRFIRESGDFAIISIAALNEELRNNILKVIEITGISFCREFNFIKRSGAQDRIVEIFQEFASMTNKKKL